MTSREQVIWLLCHKTWKANVVTMNNLIVKQRQWRHIQRWNQSQQVSQTLVSSGKRIKWSPVPPEKIHEESECASEIGNESDHTQFRGEEARLALDMFDQLLKANFARALKAVDSVDSSACKLTAAKLQSSSSWTNYFSPYKKWTRVKSILQRKILY